MVTDRTTPQYSLECFLTGYYQRGLVEREFFRWGWKLNICNFRFFGWSNQKMVKNKVVDFKNRHTSF